MHTVHDLSKGAKWLQPAAARMKRKGTTGSLTAIAAQHGQTAMEYAHQHAGGQGVSPRVRKKIQFALNANPGK